MFVALKIKPTFNNNLIIDLIPLRFDDKDLKRT